MGRERPEHRTHPPRLDAGMAFLTLGTQRTGATMAKAGSIEHANGALALRSPFLWIQRTIGGTAQRPIGLQSKSGASKAMGKGRACPLGRPILRQRRLLLSTCRLDERLRLDERCWGKFRRAQLGRGELLSQFEAKVPGPLAQDLPECLSIGAMGTPAVRSLLQIFVGEDRLKRASVQVEVEHIRAGKRKPGKGAHKQLVDHAIPLDADGWGRGGGGMASHHQTHIGSARRQGDCWAIVKRTGHPACLHGCSPDPVDAKEPA